jgi:hypothetical protein
MKSAGTHGGPDGHPFVVYHGEVNQDSDGPVEVCLPVKFGHEASTDTAVRREDAHHEAYVRLRKVQVAFPQILSAYDAVSQWITAKRLAIVGSPREVYFTDFGSAAPADEVCDVAFPVGSASKARVTGRCQRRLRVGGSEDDIRFEDVGGVRSR